MSITVHTIDAPRVFCDALDKPQERRDRIMKLPAEVTLPVNVDCSDVDRCLAKVAELLELIDKARTAAADLNMLCAKIELLVEIGKIQP